jgi:hypothetical protein
MYFNTDLSYKNVIKSNGFRVQKFRGSKVKEPYQIDLINLAAFLASGGAEACRPCAARRAKKGTTEP